MHDVEMPVVERVEAPRVDHRAHVATLAPLPAGERAKARGPMATMPQPTLKEPGPAWMAKPTTAPRRDVSTHLDRHAGEPGWDVGVPGFSLTRPESPDLDHDDGVGMVHGLVSFPSAATPAVHAGHDKGELPSAACFFCSEQGRLRPLRLVAAETMARHFGL